MIDTNVWISAFLSAGVTRSCLEFLARTPHQLFTTSGLNAEVNEVLQRKHLLPGLNALALVHSLQHKAECVQPALSVQGACRDPDDDQVLACAVAASADLILTGDRDLLTLDPFRGIRIVTPRSFLTDFCTAA